MKTFKQLSKLSKSIVHEPNTMRIYKRVSMNVMDGVTMEDSCPSPTERYPNRMVVRVKWEDEFETIENIENLY